MPRRLPLCLGVVAACLLSGAGCRQEAGRQSFPRLRVMLKMGEAFRSEGNPYLERLEKLLQIDLEIETPAPSSYNERLNVVMASEDMPDIIQLNWSGEENLPLWVRKGLIRPIDITKAPNIQINVPQTLLSMLKVGADGRVYGVPGVTTTDSYGVIIRRDWLDKLRLPVPRTLDEYISVMRAFVAGDPDGNGKDDTFGITSLGLNHFGGVFGGAFQVDYFWNTLHPDVRAADKAAKLREEQAGYMDFLDFARRAYAQNLLDREFASLQNAEDRFILGKTGMIGGYSGETVRLEKELRKFVPEAKLDWILGPADPEGRIWNFRPESYGYNGAGSSMGKNAVFLITRDADYQTALRFLDQMNTKEMILFANLGLQGLHYRAYDPNRKTIVRTEAQNLAVKRDLFGIADTYRGESHAYLAGNAAESERLDYYWRKGWLLVTNPVCFNPALIPEISAFQQMNPLFKERERLMALRYVSGAITRDDYLAYLRTESIAPRRQLSRIVKKRYHELVRALQ